MMLSVNGPYWRKVIAWVFLFLSFIGAFGDAVFLGGIPLFFFHSSKGKLHETTFMTIAIILCVFLLKPLITRVATLNKHVVVFVMCGELLMGLFELITLVMYNYFPSRWTILFAIFPLAMLYNIYAPIKFYRLQDVFFKTSQFYWTTLQSGSMRIATVGGLCISGYLVDTFGVGRILIIDATSFVIYSVGLLVMHACCSSEEPRETELSPAPTGATLDLLRFGKGLYVPFVFTAVAALFLSWEQASAVAFFSSVSNATLTSLTIMRSVACAFGICFAALTVKYRPKWVVPIWSALIIAVTAGIAFIPHGDILLIAVVLFAGAGTISTLLVPIQRDLFLTMEGRTQEFGKLVAINWIYFSIMRLTTLPIVWTSENVHFHFLNSIQACGIMILVVGMLGGFLVWRMAPQLHCKAAHTISALLLITTISFCGCTKEIQPYRVGLLGKYPQRIDPAGSLDYHEITLLNQLGGKLVSLNRTLDIEPDIAASWHTESNQTIYVFELSPLRHFADGRFVHADDVVYSIDRMRTNAGDMGSWVKEIVSVEALSPTSVRFTLANENPRFLFKLAHPRFAILSRKFPFYTLGPCTFPNSPGSYIVRSAEAPVTLTLAATADYTNKVIEKTILVSFIDQEKAVKEFLAGGLDDLSFYLLSDSQLDRVRPSANVVSSPLYWKWMLCLNPSSLLFKTSVERRLFLRSLEVAAIRKSWQATDDYDYSIIPKGLLGFILDVDNSRTEPLTKYKVPPSCTNIVIHIIQGTERENLLATSLEAEITKVCGLPVKCEITPMGDFIGSMMKRSADIYVFAIDSGTPDTLGFYNYYVPGSPDNFLGYDDAEFTKTYALLSNVPISMRTDNDYKRMLDSFNAAAFALPLGNVNPQFAVAKTVNSFYMNPFGMDFNRWYEFGRK